MINDKVELAIQTNLDYTTFRYDNEDYSFGNDWIEDNKKFRIIDEKLKNGEKLTPQSSFLHSHTIYTYASSSDLLELKKWHNHYLNMARVKILCILLDNVKRTPTISYIEKELLQTNLTELEQKYLGKIVEEFKRKHILGDWRVPNGICETANGETVLRYSLTTYQIIPDAVTLEELIKNLKDFHTQ